MLDITCNRPLSPHLQVYKFIPTIFMSILHRITGVAMYLGTVLVAWWLLAIAKGPSAFEQFSSFASYFPFKIVVFGYTWALIHHMLGGFKHLIWDMGLCFDKGLSKKLAKAHIIVSILLVFVIWIVRDYFYQ